MKTNPKKNLHDSEDRARIILDHAFQFIGLLTPDGILLEANKAALEFAGIVSSRIIGKPFWESPWWAHSQPLQEKLKQAIKSAAGGEFIRFEATHKDKDGKLHYVDFSLKPVKDDNGDVLFLVPEGRNITEYKEAEMELERYRNKLEEMVEEKTEELKKSEEQLRTIFNDSRDGMLLADIDNKRFVRCNKKICEMLGYTEEELLRLGVSKIHPETDLPRIINIFENQACGSAKIAEDLPVKRKDNSIFYADINCSIIELRGKKYLLGSFRDITDRKQAEQALREREELLTSVGNNLPNAMLYSIVREKDGRRRFVYVSDAVRRFYGCSPAEAMADPDRIYGQVVEENRASIIEAEERAFRNNSVFTIETQVHNPSGGTRWSYFSSRPTRLPDGSTRWFGVELDITERKEAEEKLRASEENYRTIFELANDAIILRDINTYEIIDANKKACEIFCYPKEELIGLSFGSLTTFSEIFTREKLKVYYDKASQGEYQSFECLSKDKFGREFWTDMNVKRAIIAGRACILCMVRDITERKRASDIKDSFTNMVSHELRTPLATIKESISLVSEGDMGPVTEKQRGMFDIVKRNADRLARLINEVLDLQKFEAGAMKFEYKKNDINKISDESYRTMLSLASKKGLSLLLKPGTGIPMAKFDKDRISEVLINLIDNAIRHTDKGTVTITTSLNDNYIKVSVQDTGHGIKNEDIPKLFQRFSQLERKAGGTGLGLAISKEIVEAHSGTIWAESEVGKGSVFHFTIPLER